MTTKQRKPVHLFSKQSTTACGYTIYTGGVLIENTTTDIASVTCKNCLIRKEFKKLTKEK